MERLFNNQIRPQAQPISSFVQPQQFRRANAAQPSLLGNVSTIVQSQQQSRGSVQGFNQLEQLANSLAPFSKQLTKGIDRGFKLYATSSIEAGYYDELENQRVRSTMNIQQQQEIAAADAAETQGQLEKVDPVAGTLLREANPWKAIGRRRALAQLAAGQVGAAMEAELVNNAGVLAGLQPGSKELAARKVAVTQSIFSRFGLNGSEPEAAVYVTPAVNKAWDKFTERQGALYNAEIYDSSVQLTNKAVMQGILGDLRDGITFPDGTVIEPGDPRFGQVAGIRATLQIDEGLKLLAGKDKREALKTINQNLAMLRASGLPGLENAVNNIRLGNSRMPMDKRPTWLQSNPYELNDYTNNALKQKQDTYELKQEAIKQDLEQRWNEEISGLPYDSSERRERINALETYAREQGYRDSEGWLRQKDDDDEARAIDTEGGGGGPALTSEERLDFAQALDQLPPSQFETPESTNAAYKFARDMAAREPTLEKKLEAYQQYVKQIQAKQKQFAGLPPNNGFDTAISNELKVSLNDPALLALKPAGATFSPIFGPQMPEGQPLTPDGQRYFAFVNNLRQAVTRKAFDKINEWREANGGAQIPIDVLRAKVADAAKEIRDSPAYQKDLNSLKETQSPAVTPRGGGPDRSGTASPNPAQAPVPAAAADTITQQQASQYRTKPIMDGKWVYQELVNIDTTRQTSNKLNDLAEKAGVAPLRMVIEQLKLYPAMDPTGEIREALLKELNKNKQSSTPAVPVLSDMDDPDRAPGSWLTGMVMPVMGVEIAQVAGLRPLPINRMVRQAGRLKNQSPSGYNAGEMLFSRRNRSRIDLSPAEVQKLLRSDPQFKKSYEKQVINGENANMTDKYGLYQGSDGSVWGSVYQPYEAGGSIQREPISREEVNRRTIERQQAAREAIENWDPIEASAREDFNRLRGGNRSLVNPGALPLADELIQTIGTPIAPPTSQMDRYGI